jgi:hypothetical protein
MISQSTAIPGMSVQKPTVPAIVLLTPKEAARWHATGAGPPKIKIGRTVFYELSKISEWLGSREIPPARDTGRN